MNWAEKLEFVVDSEMELRETKIHNWLLACQKPIFINTFLLSLYQHKQKYIGTKKKNKNRTKEEVNAYENRQKKEK